MHFEREEVFYCCLDKFVPRYPEDWETTDWLGGKFNENGQDIYIRIASSDLDSPVQHGRSNDKKKVIIIVALTIITGMFLLGLCILLYFRKRKKNDERLRTEESHVQNSRHGHSKQSQKDELELPLFDFDTIASCTNNFSADNMLGQGGFGPVHKGRLEDGREIAVKRLSKTSRQGLDEFKNEVSCIAKLQHRNLVKLLGCCIQGEERMLIYEFMPNKSLDSFIFDESWRALLDWPKRYNIISGIAHFGMARIFGGNETEINTERVVGTYGYMSPEYVVDGLFSVKSDVFSFGVLVLEIVSGKRNKGFFHPDHYLNLLGHAWTLHEEVLKVENTEKSTRVHLVEIGSVPPMGAQPEKDL
ncbi:hypothetical protein Vadar_018344 [Vaccinium darrowii]|uniref:Uncharacterized protein n=1 Tax=Vaccinium darrowii TaxID=229202 RepID=A0ACB7Y8W6_9ERIC|nr:hypothetical protein Vadar_018344 [Vaccinium darrowii]